MDRNLVLLNRNIARLRRDVRLQSLEIDQLIAADVDCTSAAQRLMRAQADLVLHIEKRERLMGSAACECERKFRNCLAPSALRARRCRPAPVDFEETRGA
jgi:hypothetical protein